MMFFPPLQSYSDLFLRFFTVSPPWEIVWLESVFWDPPESGCELQHLSLIYHDPSSNFSWGGSEQIAARILFKTSGGCQQAAATAGEENKASFLRHIMGFASRRNISPHFPFQAVQKCHVTQSESCMQEARMANLDSVDLNCKALQITAGAKTSQTQ